MADHMKFLLALIGCPGAQCWSGGTGPLPCRLTRAAYRPAVGQVTHTLAIECSVLVSNNSPGYKVGLLCL